MHPIISIEVVYVGNVYVFTFPLKIINLAKLMPKGLNNLTYFKTIIIKHSFKTEIKKSINSIDKLVNYNVNNNGKKYFMWIQKMRGYIDRGKIFVNLAC